jgi:hypothetical protein
MKYNLRPGSCLFKEAFRCSKKWFYQDSLSFGFKRRLYRSRLMEA